MPSPPRGLGVLLIRGTTVLQVLELQLVLIYQQNIEKKAGGEKRGADLRGGECSAQKQLSLLSITQHSCVCSLQDFKAQLTKTFLGGKTFLR